MSTLLARSSCGLVTGSSLAGPPPAHPSGCGCSRAGEPSFTSARGLPRPVTRASPPAPSGPAIMWSRRRGSALGHSRFTGGSRPPCDEQGRGSPVPAGRPHQRGAPRPMTALGVPRSTNPRRRHGPRAAAPDVPSGDADGRSPRVVVLTARVGAGHDRAAHELAARLRARGAVAEVRDYLDALPRFGQVIIGDGYGVVVNTMPRFFDWLFRALERRGLVRAIILTFLVCSERTVRRWIPRGRRRRLHVPPLVPDPRPNAGGRTRRGAGGELPDRPGAAPHVAAPGRRRPPVGDHRLRRRRGRDLRRGGASGRAARGPAVLPGPHRRGPRRHPP